MITLISAINNNNIIWNNNDLLYYIPEDLKRFKKLTLWKTIVMGKKTWDSLPEKYKPLPDRKNIILSRDKNLKVEKVTVYNDVNKLIYDEKDFWVIGWAQIYDLFIWKADILEITKIDDNKKWDVYFPKIPENFIIEKVSDEKIYKNLKYRYLTYSK